MFRLRLHIKQQTRTLIFLQESRNRVSLVKLQIPGGFFPPQMKVKSKTLQLKSDLSVCLWKGKSRMRAELPVRFWGNAGREVGEGRGGTASSGHTEDICVCFCQTLPTLPFLKFYTPQTAHISFLDENYRIKLQLGLKKTDQLVGSNC